jgi:ribosomal protein L37E
MPDPDYEWTCQRCAASNAPHTSLCRACGFPAQFTVRQLNSTSSAQAGNDTVSPAHAIAGVAVVGAAALIYSLLPPWAAWLGPKEIILIGLAVYILVAGLINLIKIGFNYLMQPK